MGEKLEQEEFRQFDSWSYDRKLSYYRKLSEHIWDSRVERKDISKPVGPSFLKDLASIVIKEQLFKASIVKFLRCHCDKRPRECKTWAIWRKAEAHLEKSWLILDMNCYEILREAQKQIYDPLKGLSIKLIPSSKPLSVEEKLLKSKRLSKVMHALDDLNMYRRRW